MSLSSLIVQREIATIREVEEALARQVLYGGDLVTNLLEVATVDEGHITPLLAESFGMQPAPVGELPIPPDDARALVPAELCVQKNLVPLAVDRAGVTVAVAEPLAPDVEQELSFALSLPVAQRIAPHVRVRQAIARAYGAPLERRLERLVARLSGREASVPNSLPPLLREPPVVRQPPRPPSDLPGATSLSSSRLAAARVAPAPREPDLREPEPAAELRVPPAAATGFTPTGGLDAAPRPAAAAAAPAAPARPTKLRPVRRRRGPLVSEVAQDEMEGAEERDGILDLYFEYCRQYFDYTALFIVQGDIAEGWDAFGDGVPRERVVEIGIPLDMPSMLLTARQARKPLRAAPSKEDLDAVWTKDLGLSGRRELFVAPLVVRGRVVALLVGDGGDGGVDAESAKEATWFAGLAGAALERVILKKKAQRKASAPPVAPAAAERSAPPPAAAPREAVEASGPPPRLDIAVAVGQGVTLDAIRETAARSAPPAAGPERGSDPVLSVPATLATPVALGVSPGTPTLAEMVATTPSSLEEALAAAESSMPPTDRDAEPPTTTQPASTTASKPKLELAMEQPKLELVAEPEPEERPTDVDGVPPVEVAPVLPEPPPERISIESPPTRPEGQRIALSRSADSSNIGPAPSSDQRSVAPHKPPSSQLMPPVLPSVIVDSGKDFGPIVARYVDDGDEAALSELLRAGQHAMPAIMARFPGPITIDMRMLDAPPLPKASRCGPLLRLIAGQRKVALPFVLELVQSLRFEIRLWATLLVVELPYADAIPAVAGRIFDDDGRVRAAARTAARAIAEHHPTPMIERLSKVALDVEELSTRRVLALDALGDLRDALAVPGLITALSDPGPEVSAAARAALVLTTKKDLGTDTRKWLLFWQASGRRHRLEWLIDALGSDVTETAQEAADELVEITRQDFGFSADAPKKERDKVMSRYREWWATEGRHRFTR